MASSVLLQILLLLSTLKTGTALMKEANALLQWKSSLEMQHLSSWHDSSNSAPCSWGGVLCDHNGRISQLNLSSSGLKGTLHNFSFSTFPALSSIILRNNKLSGTIPRQIINLQKLVFLDLAINNFVGEIPTEIGMLKTLQVLYLFTNELHGPIPSTLGDLKSLVVLAVSTNNLTGSIPPSLGGLRNLSRLLLFQNQLSGYIPSQLGNLSNLLHLKLDDNFLAGQMPSTLGNLTKLTKLYLYKNRLVGSIPPQLGRLNSLSELSIHTNNLSGQIPASLGGLNSLTLLHLYGNQFSGLIPLEFKNLNSIVDFELSNNKITGPIPAWIGNLTNLETLHLRENQLDGLIPPDIGNLTMLTVLQLDTNHFKGYLPENICQAGVLQKVSLDNNKLVGTVPRSIKNCTSLVRLRLNNNLLTGDISEVFGVYPDLTFMDVSDNRFYGEIPPNLVWSKKLRDLNMARNNISGTIPDNWEGTSQLGRLDLSSNKLVGGIPKDLLIQTFLQELNLRDNQLFGEIPLELGSVSRLTLLDLSNNRFSGSIPESIGELSGLLYLNLSNNQLSQEIPSQIGNLINLQILLDLSCNSLIGAIPSRMENLKMLVNMNLSHNKLSGQFPEVTLKSMLSLSYVDLSYNELHGHAARRDFKNLFIVILRGNNDLCGDIGELQSCSVKQKHGNKKGLKLALFVTIPVFAIICFAFTLFGIYLSLQKRGKTKQSGSMEMYSEYNFFVEPNFDGRRMYGDIVKGTNTFDADHCIGEGSHGNVYIARLASQGLVLAVKKLHPQDINEMEDLAGFQNEIKAITQIRHRNIVKLMGFCLEGAHKFLVYEFVGRGSLARLLLTIEEALEMTWELRVKALKGVACALSYMHHDCSPPIVHRDISSKNVLLDYEYEAKVSDFGTVKFLKVGSSSMTEAAGTYGYMAPEIAYMRKVTDKCDVYSFGVLMLEVIYGKHPSDFLSALEGMQHKDLFDQRLPPPMDQTEEDLISIIDMAVMCLKPSPQSRPSMHTVSQLLSGLELSNRQ